MEWGLWWLSVGKIGIILVGGEKGAI